MYKRYNLYNPEPYFKKYLLAGNVAPVTVKNYLSDFRHFWGWLIFKLRANTGVDLAQIGREKIISYLRVANLQEYRDYLVENNLPRKTINRRLSTLRKFCSFCILQGWMEKNPAKQISNVKKIKRLEKDVSLDQALNKFKEKLANEAGAEKTSLIISDIKEFFETTSSKKGFRLWLSSPRPQ